MKLQSLFYTIGIVAVTTAATTTFTSCDDEAEYSISSNELISQITTDGATVTAISAVVQGTVSDLSKVSPARYQVGAIYGATEDLQSSGTRVVGTVDADGKITANITGLTQGNTYYYATFVLLQGKVLKLGEVKSLVATNAAVATADATGVSANKVTLNGQVNGADDVLDASTVGFRYALSADEVETGYYVSVAEAIGTFSATLSGLLPATTYYYAAVSQVDKNALVGNVSSFTTESQEIEYVDLGLSVLWAKTNIGAESEEELGARGGFGDQTFFERSSSADYYTPWDLEGDDDMTAMLDLDGYSEIKSKMPTVAQFKELIANTTQEVAEVNGVKGIRFTAANKESIFLPLAGYRDGEAIESLDAAGFYWSKQMSPSNELYAKSLCLNADGTVSMGDTRLNLALPVRTVRAMEGIYVSNARLKYGDIEGNGNFRIDIYNEWDGSGACGDESPINRDDVVFHQNLAVTFQLSGITAEGDFQAYMVFSDGTWTTQNWSYNDNGNASCIVNGDGVYTMMIDGAGSGLGIFAIDVLGLGTACGGTDGITAKIIKLEADVAKSGIKVNTSNLVFGDIESNGRLRLELYNEYGESKANPVVDVTKLVCNKNMAVTFKLGGITDNLKEGAPESFVAGLEYSDPTWGVSYWSDLQMHQYEALVNGDGTYTVWAEFGSTANGAVVFCVDIADLMANIVDPDKVTAEIISVVPDANVDQVVEAAPVSFQNKDGNGVDGRIEIYNEYGNGGSVSPQVYNDKLKFSGLCAVQFTIAGIDGNLKEGAAGSYKSELSYAAASWDPNYWGGAPFGSAEVTKDGTYTVFAWLNGNCSGAVVWTIELYGLWQDLVSTESVTVSVDRIITPNKL